MFFNVNQVITQLSECSHTNGLLQAEKEVLEAECEKQALEIKCLRDELSAVKEELASQKSIWEFTYSEKEKYKKLYEKFAEIETPEQILEDLPEALK